MTSFDLFGRILVVLRNPQGHQSYTAGGFVPVSSDKEVRDMPITITFHIFGFTVTVRIKGRNRHSAK